MTGNTPRLRRLLEAVVFEENFQDRCTHAPGWRWYDIFNVALCATMSAPKPMVPTKPQRTKQHLLIEIGGHPDSAAVSG